MSQSSGAAEYWLWYGIEPNNELFHFTAAHHFIEQSGVLEHENLKPLEVAAETSERGTLRFGPGSGWRLPKRPTSTSKPAARWKASAECPHTFRAAAVTMTCFHPHRSK